MSGRSDCPMCRQRTVYAADNVTPILRDLSCIGAAGCVLKDAMIENMLRNAEPYLKRMQAEADAARETRIQAARVRETRIRDAQLAVLAAARRYRASFEPQSPDSPCDTGLELDDAIFAMVEVEGGASQHDEHD